MVTSAIMNTYGNRTTTLIKGEGAYVWDADDRRYLDAVSGIAVCGLGHCHPAVTEALCNQANTLIHCSNLYNIEPQQALGDALIDVSGMEKVFFSNSGAEANEAAIKIARKYGNSKGIEDPQVITASGSFHGRTMATLTATGNPKVKEGFTPLLSGFDHVPYDDIEAIKSAATDSTVAVLVEPVQGEGGVHVPSEQYLPALRELCDANGWLLMLDEIQTGNGRTGKFFAYQHYSFLPDVVTTAKGLGNGVPIGACLTQGKASEILQPGNHGSTFGGNPLATKAALAVINTLTNEKLIERADVLGQAFIKGFEEQLSNESAVKDIRGKGLMIGIELDRDCAALVEQAKEKGLLINVTAGNTVRLLPPLILSDEQAHTIIDTVSSLIKAFVAQ
ncbi:MAG: acetylornithine transaminase [Agarilytica sp.]